MDELQPNFIVEIGYMGDKTCYLNISKEKAIERYCLENDISLNDFYDEKDIDVNIIAFNDSFKAYSIY